MIEEIATVVSIENDIAVVRVEKTSSCNSCQAKGACGTSSLSSYFNFQSPGLKVKNSIDAKAGDQVIVSIQEKTLVTGSFLLYIVPLLIMILFAFAAITLQPVFPSLDQELFQTLSGLAGLAAGLIIVKQISVHLLKGNNSAVLVKILQGSPQRVSVNQLQL